MINCVIIEDEPLAQNGLVKLINQHNSLSISAVCDDVEDFLDFQKENKSKRIDANIAV